MRRRGLMRWLGVCLALGLTACRVPAPIPPTPARLLPLGINDAFHGPLPPKQVTTYCHSTVRTPQVNVEGLRAYYDSIAGCPIRTIVLVEAPDVALAQDLARILHPGDLIELGNELELPPSNLTLDQFAAFIHAACVPNAITGGVYTLNADTRQRLIAAHAACPSALLGLHLYEPLTQDDINWLSALPVHAAVTETGFPTRCDPARIPQQAQYLSDMRSLLSTVPTIDLMVVYQRPIGPTCSDFDTFGIDGLPAEGMFR